MRYLTIAADYTQSCLRDDFEGLISPEELNLPRNICIKLHYWNELYRQVIPLDEKQRSEEDIKALIAKLDQEGLALAEDVKQLVHGGAKVRYFSEGELRYLN